ncbi:hypothetical protein RchiOBHm_Chr7g0213391 [Rosa chinensis]|uniref:Exopolysaccharide production negative regulator n=1 Tax=Rosa chinensis TaxID=74649 RepID=A0A2P6PAZ7_ROSCH|nr:uncharacterized protein LOC112179452 [Rosa chinensis]PRQ19100.1 hypothetical protein RchiOBHm_Chr7g0213391 [Rosa chinensis]
MDSQDVSQKKGYLILRWSLAVLFPIVAFCSLSLFLVLVTVFVSNSSVSGPISVSSQCRIVSSSVDLKSAKVCELGLFNYKAKHVFYPLEGRRFRCRHDYYWASVFKVEYQDQSSGQTRVALAEAPSEALPLNCRPNFGAAWLTKDKFKVNKTYDCWYTYGVSQVSLYDDGFFSCQAKDPSTFEMIRRYFILSTKILRSWFLSQEPALYWRWETIIGLVTGFSTALISISFFKLMQLLKSQLPQISARRMLTQSISAVLFRRTCFLVAYISFMGWLAIEYGKRLGLPEILTLLKE